MHLTQQTDLEENATMILVKTEMRRIAQWAQLMAATQRLV
jgi:hypothetical protein